MTNNPPRRVRPGEVPRFGSVWSWHPNGPKYVALGLASGLYGRLNFVGLQLLAWPPLVGHYLNWTQPALVGMGPVLADWYCHDEGLVTLGMVRDYGS